MMKPTRVIEIELSQPLESVRGLGEFGHGRGLVRLYGDPLGWVDVPVKDGECRADDLAATILAEQGQRIVARLLAAGVAAGADLERMTLPQLLALVGSMPERGGRRPRVTLALCWPVSGASVDAGVDANSNAAGGDSGEHAVWAESLAAIADLFPQSPSPQSPSPQSPSPQAPSPQSPSPQSPSPQSQPLDQPLEILVVGAPAQPMADGPNADPTHRYIPSAELDLNRLRNLAIAQAQGDIVAFLSPEVRVTPSWLAGLVQAFVEDPSLAAVTGPLVPSEQITASLSLLEQHQLWSQGWERQRCRMGDRPQDYQAQVLFPSGLNPENFALRKSALADTDAFANLAGSLPSLAFSLMSQGKTLLYEPRMWVYNHGSQAPAMLQTQVRQRAIARASYFAQGWLLPGAVPARHRWTFFKESLGGLRWSMRCWLMERAELRPFHAAEVQGTIVGLGQILSRGSQLRQAQADLLAPEPQATPQTAHQATPQTSPQASLQDGPQAANVTLALQLAEQSRHMQVVPSPEEAFGSDIATRTEIPTAVRTLDLGKPLTRLEGLGKYDRVRIFVTRHGTILGSVDLDNHHGPLGIEALSQGIVKGLGPRLFSPLATVEQVLTAQVSEWLRPPAQESLQAGAIAPLPSSVKVSVIITTCDRPTDLRNCLRHLVAQVTPRQVEIIVADNRPASGITPPIVAEFPGVKLVCEPRIGGSYGRNSAFCASTGEIVATVDDDVSVPPDWLEKLIAPMARPEVMVVTGNVLPRELETEAQRLYEDLYGGLSEGFEAFEVDGQWLSSFHYSPPVWDLGVSANSAFRASVFHHPEIGMMPEALGPGTPVGGGEENYLIYRILKAGHTLVYEPSAYVWHRHRRTVPQLRYQIYRQMMGGTAYHLMLWLVDKDNRGLQQLTKSLPRYFAQRLVDRIRGKHQVPWSFLWAEIAGSVSGIWGYYQSLSAVQRQGRSAPYVPVAERGELSLPRHPNPDVPRPRPSSQVISG